MGTVSTNVSVAEIMAYGDDPSLACSVIDVEHWITHDACMTRIVARIQHDIVEITGTSKRDPGDRENQQVGMMLSSSRAYANLARRLSKRAYGVVEHHSNIKKQRPIQLQRSAEWKKAMANPDSSTDDIISQTKSFMAGERAKTLRHKSTSHAADYDG